VTVETEARVDFSADESDVTLEIALVAAENGETVATRTWREVHPRRLG
jgi:hypothetical protein